jgi:UDP-GlcNAc:undecaprenyl-phosphate GlcNAc-1-phosphate transferase
MTPYWRNTFIFVFLFSLIFSLVITPLVRYFAQKLQIYDRPDKRKIHTRAVPLWGGIAVFLPFAFSLFLTRYYSNPLKIIVYGACVALIVGVIDDIRKGLSGTVKFFILVGLTLLLVKYGIVLHLLPHTNVFFYTVDIILTILWVVGVTSAFNAIDNMDGLAAGVACIAATFFFIVAVQTGKLWFGMLSAALAGSCLGFLRYNFRPATIFLGDAGSFFLGFTLAAMSVMGEWNENPFIASVIPVFILGIPIFDIIYVVVWRHANKVTRTFSEALSHCAKDHLSHRLVALGFSQRRAVLLIYLLAICTGICAIVLRNSTSGFDSILLMIQGLVVLLIIMEVMIIGTRHIQEKYALGETIRSLKSKMGIAADKTRILVVDDDENVRNLITEFLASKHYEVLAANDGQSAIALLENNPVRLVLLDVVFPGAYSGIDILRHIKKQHADIPVIMITGYNDARTEIAELSYDAFGEIKKPFKLEDLEALIEKALKDSRSADVNVILGNTNGENRINE